MIILSNNQWKCDRNYPTWKEKDEDCSSDARVDGLMKAYLSVNPDVICLQEASEHMLQLMMNRFSCRDQLNYSLISGRDTPIFYRSDKFTLVESGYCLFPEEIPGLQGSYNNEETKSYSYAILRERLNQRMIGIMSLHLWWKSSNKALPYYQEGSDEARTWQLALALQQMESLGKKHKCPCFVLGDFNAEINDPCLKYALENGWNDVYFNASQRDETSGYHLCGPEGYEHKAEGTFFQAIDHILVKYESDLQIRRFCRISPEWFDKLSDHYPLFVDIE